MDLISKLSELDQQKLHYYLNSYGGDYDIYNALAMDELPYFLRHWSFAKQNLYKVFGEQFILTKPISVQKSIEELSEEMERALRYSDSVANEFGTLFKRHINGYVATGELTYDDGYELKRFVTDYDMLAANIYNGVSFCIPGSITKDGRPLQINQGAKALKMLGKICEAIGFKHTRIRCKNCGFCYDAMDEGVKCQICLGEEFEVVDGYELFRRQHSLVLNQKTIKGNICLSIHPLDYVTMSDNECGWSSCMQWMNESGDYRLGTIEMMNSPYVVVAYMESSNSMDIGNDYLWNSKRWRQLVIITPELILGNKQYPYESDALQGAILTWIRDLFNASGEYGVFCQEAVQIANHRTNFIGKHRFEVSLNFRYMYNDIYNEKMGFLNASFNAPSICYNLSGPAVCTNCGAEIDYDPDCVDPSSTMCPTCSGKWRCCGCGGWHSGDPYYFDDRDDPYCDWCYHDNRAECEVCKGTVHDNNVSKLYLQLLPLNEEVEYDHYNWTYYVNICQDCLTHHPEKVSELFGEVYETYNTWGVLRQCVSLDNCSDEGLERGSLPHSAVEVLRQARAIKSNRERALFLEKNLY